jgi:hypothetical protein
VNALANVSKSPRISAGAAPAIAWSAFASSAMPVWALPDIGCIAWAIFAPSAISSEQFFVDPNDELTFEVDVDCLVVVAAVVVGDADFLADPPQAVTTTRRTTARSDTCMNRIVLPLPCPVGKSRRVKPPSH